MENEIVSKNREKVSIQNTLIDKINNIVEHKKYDEINHVLIDEIETCIEIYKCESTWDEVHEALTLWHAELKDIHMEYTQKSKHIPQIRAIASSPTASKDTTTFTPSPQLGCPSNTPTTNNTPTTEDDTDSSQPPIVCSNKSNQLPQVKPTPSKAENTHLRKNPETHSLKANLKPGVFTKVPCRIKKKPKQSNSTKLACSITTLDIEIHQTIGEVIRKLDYPNLSHTDIRSRYDNHNNYLKQIVELMNTHKDGPKKTHYSSIIVILDNVVAATQEYDYAKDEIHEGRTSKLDINQIQETALTLKRNIAIITKFKEQYQALGLGSLAPKIHACTQSALTKHQAILQKIRVNQVHNKQIKPAAWR